MKRETPCRPAGLILSIALALSPAARAAGTLDERLDRLYDEVSTRFEQNPWFKNSADPDVNPPNARGVAPVPEYRMVDRELFRNSLKGYCVLLESPQAKNVKNRGRLAIVNYTQPSAERRLYVYDVASQSVIHNLWTSHAANSRIGFWYNLAATELPELEGHRKDVVMSYNETAIASLFSNREGSEMSSVGMAIADTQTYFSAKNNWTALRLTGVDGPLNSLIYKRAVVFHEWGYTGSEVRYSGMAPLSQGCPMLPTRGTYQGRTNVEIAKLIMSEVYGSPVMLYHDRLKPEVNEATYREQLETMKSLRADLTETMLGYQADYGWDDQQRARYEAFFVGKLDEISARIEESYKYFRNRSAYYGVEPKNPGACLKALGL